MGMSPSTASTEATPRLTTDTAPLHGVRTIFSVSVVIYHTLLFVPLALHDAAGVNKLISGSVIAHGVSLIATLGNTSVDIFLLISGFFLQRSFSSKRVTPYRALRYTVFRFLRLSPAYLSIAFALRLFGNQKCIKPPEFFLLHLTDFVELCIFCGWSTNVDFVSHVLLLPVLHRPRILATILMLIPPLKLWKWYQLGTPMPPLSTVLSFSANEQQLDFWSNQVGFARGRFNPTDSGLVSSRNAWFAYKPLYFWLIYRIAAVVVGIFLYCAMRDKNTVYRAVRRFPTVSGSCVIVILIFFHVVEFNLFSHHWMKIIHISTGRILLPLAVSIIIMLTCTIDDYPLQHRISHFLRTVLSFRVFTFLHKFTYVVYLLHLGTAFVLGKVSPKVTHERVAPMWVLVMGIKWYLLTTVIGLPLWAFEWLALKGRRWLLKKLSDIERSRKDFLAPKKA